MLLVCVNLNFQATIMPVQIPDEANPSQETLDKHARARRRLREISLKKAILFLLVFMIPLIIMLVVLNLYQDISKLNTEIISVFTFYLLMGILIFYAFAKKKVSLMGMFSKIQNSRDILLFIPLMAFSIGSFWFILLIFHNIDPSLGQWYFNSVDNSGLMTTSADTHYYQYLAIFILIAVLVPIIEEIIFRGAFIERLGTKYSYQSALITSAIIFGFLHFDIFGAAMFGLVSGIIYLKSKSLTVPVLIHMLNNGILILLLVINDQLVHLGNWGETVQDFVDYAYVGILLFILSTVPLVMYLKQNWNLALRSV